MVWDGERVAVLANGRGYDVAQVRALAEQADAVIAADGGSNVARQAGLCPALVVGDMDSVTSETMAWLRDNGAELLRHPSAKDETDLELALLEAARRGAKEVVVLAALGGRTDQLLANISLLALPELAAMRCYLVSGVETILLLRGSLELSGAKGDLVSLIPIGGDAHGIWTDGLAYPLAGESLWWARARGISNVLAQPKAMVQVGEGCLVVVHRGTEPVMIWPDFQVRARRSG